MILQIGNHQFDVDMSYETLERVSAWEWGEVPIVGDYPILQNVRKSAPTLSFTGLWFNYVATGDRVQDLEIWQTTANRWRLRLTKAFSSGSG